MRGTILALVGAVTLLAGPSALGAAEQAPATRPRSMVGWVSDGHCGAEHMKTGGAACVRKCIAGAVHVNPEWKPGGMVFVTQDKQVWRVDNPDVLWGHESRQLEVLAAANDEKKSIRVEKVVKVLQR